jgi:hypothetical protein
MATKGLAYDKFDLYCSTVGIPNPIITDGAGEETGGLWDKVRKKHLTQQCTTEPHSPWQNKAEREIQELKKHYRRIMHRSKCPESFWDFGIEYVSQIRERMSRTYNDNRTPLESTTGETPDISEYLDFGFYDWVKFHDVHNSGNENELGRWLGVAENVGQAMCYYVLKSNGKVLSRSTVRPLLREEWLDNTEEADRKAFDEKIAEMYGKFDETLILSIPNDEMAEPVFGDEDDADPVIEPSLSTNDTVSGPDEFCNAEIYLPHGDRNEIAKVLGRKRD